MDLASLCTGLRAVYTKATIANPATAIPRSAGERRRELRAARRASRAAERAARRASFRWMRS